MVDNETLQKISRREALGTLGAVAAALAIGASVPASAADGQRRGSFTGASGHSTRGTVTVKTSGGATVVEFHGNFSFDGAPDPWVGFGRNGRFVGATRFAKLKSNAGAQRYSVPSGIDVSSMNEVYLWCHRYSVPMGIAKID